MEVRHLHEYSDCTTAGNSSANRGTPATQQKPVIMQLSSNPVLNKTHASGRMQISIWCLITVGL